MGWYYDGQLDLPLGLPAIDRIRPRVYTSEYLVREHHTGNPHYDFRLQMGDVAKSWVVPKGPSRDPAQRRLAIQVEDHSPRGLMAQGWIRTIHGVGMAYRWDYGKYLCLDADPLLAWQKGRLRFILYGKKLQGGWELHREPHGRRGRQEWRLLKVADEWAKPGDYAVMLGMQMGGKKKLWIPSRKETA